MYMLLPVGGLDDLPYWSLSPVPGAAAGRERFVSIVTLTLMRPYARANERYIMNDGPNPVDHGWNSLQLGKGNLPSQHASLVEKGFSEQ